MNNNQFKKLIRTQIEAECQARKLMCIYLDLSFAERMYYVYKDNMKPAGTLSVYLNSSGVRLRMSSDKIKAVNISNAEISYTGFYLDFIDIKSKISNCIKALS